jgi:hypothetical protein
MIFFQGIEVVVKVLVVGAGHLGEKDIIELVGPYKKANERMVSLGLVRREEFGGVGHK